MGLKEDLKTIPRYVKILEENGIHNLKDFFNNFPRTYEDRSQIKPLNELIYDEKGKTATKVKITKKTIFQRGGKTIYNIEFQDINEEKGVISIFNS